MSTLTSESGEGLTLDQIRRRLKEEHDRLGKWGDVGDMFGISGYWASKIAKGKDDPSEDLQDRMERVLTRPRPASGATPTPQRERLALWLEWLAEGVRTGLLPVFDLDPEGRKLQRALRSATEGDGTADRLGKPEEGEEEEKPN